MNIRHYLIASATLLITNTSFGQKSTLKGSLLGVAPSEKIYLFKYFGSELSKADSTKIADNQFEFKFKKALPYGFYRVGLSAQKSVALVLGKEAAPQINGDLAQPEKISFSNSPDNQLYLQYTEYNRIFGKNVAQLQQSANSLGGLQESEPARFQAEMVKLKTKFDSLANAQNDFYKKLNTENPTLFVGKLAGLFMTDAKTDSSNYFRKEDFTNDEFLRGDMLGSKCNIFLQKFVKQDMTAWQTAAKAIVAFAPAKSDGREVVYNTLVNLFMQIDQSFAATLGADYVKEYPKSNHAKNLVARLPKPEPSVGEIAPNIKLKDRDGKEVELSSLRGKVVLLDFWASWCGPCRMENPNVVKAYDHYKDKGFTIFSVSLDDNRDRWLQAIEKDKLSWPNHVSDLKGWRSAGAALYQVHSIPATFLIDRDGRIIAKNLRGAALDNKLKSLLEK